VLNFQLTFKKARKHKNFSYTPFSVQMRKTAAFLTVEKLLTIVCPKSNPVSHYFCNMRPQTITKENPAHSPTQVPSV
jgi:hypothetical protein